MVNRDGIFWGNSQSIADYDYEQFQRFLEKTPEELEQACRDRKGRLKHIIRAEHFSLDFMNLICETAEAARGVASLEDKSLKSLLSSKSVLNFFKQPSSRTFLSFSMAEAHLGMRREEVRDIQTSSEVKGESEKDSLRTISSYFDAIVCRHPSAYYDRFMVWVMQTSNRELPCINGGSGAGEHPTQALTDYYTDWKAFKGNLDGKNIAFVGDCKRGRTIHSGAKVLALHKNVTMYFVAPEDLQIDSDTENYVKRKGVRVIKETKALDNVIEEADIIYMTRIQNEHGGSGDYDPNFIFKKEMLPQMKPTAILEHPLPKREEIDPEIDYIKNEPRLQTLLEPVSGLKNIKPSKLSAYNPLLSRQRVIQSFLSQ